MRTSFLSDSLCTAWNLFSHKLLLHTYIICPACSCFRWSPISNLAPGCWPRHSWENSPAFQKPRNSVQLGKTSHKLWNSVKLCKTWQNFSQTCRQVIDLSIHEISSTGYFQVQQSWNNTFKVTTENNVNQFDNFCIFKYAAKRRKNLFKLCRNQEMLFIKECAKNACWARSAWHRGRCHSVGTSVRITSCDSQHTYIIIDHFNVDKMTWNWHSWWAEPWW